MHTVRWLSEAEEELVAIWTEASDSGVIAHAATEINRLLEIDPLGVGESRRVYDERVIYVLPLGAEYQVHRMRAEVTVISTWLVRRNAS